MSPEAEILDRRILAFIASAGASEPFDALAADLFAFQVANNRVYRAYCEGLDTRDIDTWRDIPAVWPVSWRMTELCSFDPADAVATFLSSGTTAGPGRDDAGTQGRSRHLFDTLDLYRAALAGPFAEAMAPEPDRRFPVLVLMPSPDEQPDSSLGFMMGEAIARFGLPEASGFFSLDGRLLPERFALAVERTSAIGQPLLLASTAFGWVTLLDWLGERRLPLPAGSRIMETGGYKGRTREWSRADLYAALSQSFAVRENAIVSEYGMCELSSQFYGMPGPSEGPRFSGPPWTRVLAIDPETQQPVPPGEPSLLRVIDLANRGSCIAVQTEDLVVVHDEQTFELLGRAPSAPPKGCSLTAEDLHLSSPEAR
ncbi:MAG: hypothetical protein PHU85_04055 [Phycisphaerae bacterium]|nr:hypothetical protein [Phycisphaerae bacterium]